MDAREVPTLQARLPDPSKIPSNQLELEMLVTIFLTAALAYFTYGLRMYSRAMSKQIGLGKHGGPVLTFLVSWC